MQYRDLILLAIELLRPYVKFYLIMLPFVIVATFLVAFIDSYWGKLSEGE